MHARLYAPFVALLFAISTSVATQGLSGTLLVANRTGGSISLFDLATAVEIARLPIGPAIPHEVGVSPDGRLALTGEYGPNDAPGRHVVIIDVAEARIVGRIDLGPKSRPHSVVFMPDGRRAVVTLEQSDRIALLDVVESARASHLSNRGPRRAHGAPQPGRRPSVRHQSRRRGHAVDRLACQRGTAGRDSDRRGCRGSGGDTGRGRSVGGQPGRSVHLDRRYPSAEGDTDH